MDIELIREICLSQPFADERFPFDETTLCFCVGGKMFALCDLERCDRVNLKCDPTEAIDLRERYEGIEPGWHMNKRHWNSVYFDSDVPATLFRTLVEQSYQLVFNSLTRKQKQELSASEK